jgi:hypothetical protein
MKTSGELSPVERIALSALHSLPDSVQKREELLRDIIATIRGNSEVKIAAKQILLHLLEHKAALEKLQPDLPLKLK